MRSFRARRLQTLLLLIALAASYAAAAGVLAVLTSFHERVASDLRRIGWGVINVHPSPDPKKFWKSLLSEGLVAELARVAGGPSAVASLETTLVSAPSGGGQAGEAERPAVLAVGTSASWASLVDLELAEGRFFEDGKAGECVLDEWVARRVFGDETAAGRDVVVSIGGKDIQLRVVGVAEDPFRIRERLGALEGAGGIRSILVRMLEYKNVYMPRAAMGTGKPILFALLGVPPGREPEEARTAVRRRLEGLGSTAVAWDRKSWAERIIGATGDITALASFLWVAILAITALMAAVILAIAVRGRYREIAIRRIEGARRAEVLAQLILENGILSAAAALLGFAAAKVAGVWIEREVLGWPIVFKPSDLLLVLVSGTALAIVTTLLPARRAASLPPVEMLRTS